MKIHPDAAIFPDMKDDEFSRLADDIAAHGLQDPITLLDGKILDGRHRQRACEERQVEPKYVDWDPACGITPLEWVISKNLHRRQLSVSQRAVLAAELQDRLAEAARTRQLAGLRRGKDAPVRPNSATRKKTEQESAFIAGQQFGIGKTSVKQAAAIKKADPELLEEVRQGKRSLHDASQKIGYSVDGHGPSRKTKVKLAEVLLPLKRYLKNWDEERLRGISPKEARKLLALVQEVDAGLFEVERALEERTIVSRALQ